MEITLTNDVIHVAPDWYGLFVNFGSGVVTAVATMCAVIYTNRQTKKQLKEQERKFENERKEEFKRSKYVVITPKHLLTSFADFMESLIIRDNQNRILLFSGKDGFDFFDDNKKRLEQICRLLLIENKTDIDISEIKISTRTTLKNNQNDQEWMYDTNNGASLLRGHESIIVRMTDQTQFEQILSMTERKIPNTLNFRCQVEYSTLANQRITYVYEIEINNDNHIEVKKDEIESVVDLSQNVVIERTIFRNLQDFLSKIDRADYYWQKMMEAQVKVIFSFFPSLGPIKIANNKSDTDTVS